MSKRKVKVGDELAFRSGSGYIWIQKVDRITPTGRIVCGSYTLNPDLSVRGLSQWSSGPYRGEVVTEELRAEMKATAERAENISIVRNTVFRRLSDSQLATIVEILRNGDEEVAE
ncbi:hypothetical protein [Kordiimonas sp.]|uniref:hypothetical protein n=1 Tax=Kordiimonas sp. TaxID=1970157 RepID=UPI003A935A3E